MLSSLPKARYLEATMGLGSSLTFRRLLERKVHRDVSGQRLAAPLKERRPMTANI